MNAKIFVTGGTGGLSSHTVPLLRAAGYDLRILSRTPREDTEGIEYVTGDLLTDVGLEEALAGAETVLHLAGARKGDDIATTTWHWTACWSLPAPGRTSWPRTSDDDGGFSSGPLESSRGLCGADGGVGRMGSAREGSHLVRRPRPCPAATAAAQSRVLVRGRAGDRRGGRGHDLHRSAAAADGLVFDEPREPTAWRASRRGLRGVRLHTAGVRGGVAVLRPVVVHAWSRCSAHGGPSCCWAAYTSASAW